MIIYILIGVLAVSVVLNMIQLRVILRHNRLMEDMQVTLTD